MLTLQGAEIPLLSTGLLKRVSDFGPVGGLVLDVGLGCRLSLLPFISGALFRGHVTRDGLNL